MRFVGTGSWRWATMAAVVLVTLTTACGSESAGGPVELTLLDHQEPRVELLKEMIPRFEKEMKEQGKNIQVEILEGPLSVVYVIPAVAFYVIARRALQISLAGGLAGT